MSNRVTKASREEAQAQVRFSEAHKNFKRMQDEIAPFVKRRRFRFVSTAGRWYETSSLAAQDKP